MSDFMRCVTRSASLIWAAWINLGALHWVLLYRLEPDGSFKP